MEITEEMYAQHDCHLTDEDGCTSCEIYWSQPLVHDQYADAVTLATREANEAIGLVF